MGGIRSETTRMEHLVADLLLLARLDEGRPMENRSVDLVALCAEAVQTASTVGPAWPLTFAASEPIEVLGDATSLRQVIDNLLGNIRAHTPPGSTGRVSVDRDGAYAVIAVTDNGPGMDPDEAEHVFERFYRSDPSRSRTHGGAGLGLSIVSAIVAAHGGTVSAQGAAGTGTTFTVRLPASPHVPTSPPRPTPTLTERAGQQPGSTFSSNTQLTPREHRIPPVSVTVMTVLPFARAQHNGAPTTVEVDIVIPVYNEEGRLEACITALRTFLDTSFPFDAVVHRRQRQHRRHLADRL